MTKQSLYFFQLSNIPIQNQLEIEENFLRKDERNFCIVNYGSPKTIVMGISGKKELLLDEEKVAQDQIPVIRRFSGGGTVFIDENTLFITFIFSHQAINIPIFPEPIMRWSAELYQKAWPFKEFALRENDYVIGDKKCGGNAQYIKRGRWLHHTSFLWKYNLKNMQYLLLPPQRPKYRQDRSHSDFLTALKMHYPASLEKLIEDVKKELVKRFYIIPSTL